MSSPSEAPPPVDLELLRGFRFSCRPDCGLCCYATPRADGPERERIVRRFPATRFLASDRDRFLASRPNGGACQFLDGFRCRAHAVRPHPCREFPLTVHVGHRLQASVVLSCPGITAEAFEALGARGSRPEPVGFETELASIAERLGAATARRLDAASRRGRALEHRLRARGRWNEPDEVRATLSDDLELPDADDFPVDGPPSLDEGVENLPLFFDRRAGPVAFSEEVGGWALTELAPSGEHRPLTTLVPPDRPPVLEPAAERLLAAYLRYWLDRDAFWAATALEMEQEPEGTLLERARRALHEVGAQTVARASVRRKLRLGAADRLARDDVWEGIAATDQDWLDRPTWGERL